MIGIVSHVEKPGAVALVRGFCEELHRRNVPFLVESESARRAQIEQSASDDEIIDGCELVVVMGGDGTILRFVRRAIDRLPPVFGINLGSLGFLTCLGANELARAAEAIAGREYVLSDRHLFRIEHRMADGTVQTSHALNDVVISRGERSQLVRIEVRIDGQSLTNYNADGLILATPTGSTAYSLSAGGPILMPDSGGAVITPICPHVLTNRSTVVSDRSVIEVLLSKQDQEVFFNADGQPLGELRPGEVLRVSKGERALPLAMLPERPFTEVLRHKLKWSGSNI